MSIKSGVFVLYLHNHTSDHTSWSETLCRKTGCLRGVLSCVRASTVMRSYSLLRFAL